MNSHQRRIAFRRNCAKHNLLPHQMAVMNRMRKNKTSLQECLVHTAGGKTKMIKKRLPIGLDSYLSGQTMQISDIPKMAVVQRPLIIKPNEEMICFMHSERLNQEELNSVGVKVLKQRETLQGSITLTQSFDNIRFIRDPDDHET